MISEKEGPGFPGVSQMAVETVIRRECDRAAELISLPAACVRRACEGGTNEKCAPFMAVCRPLHAAPLRCVTACLLSCAESNRLLLLGCTLRCWLRITSKVVVMHYANLWCTLTVKLNFFTLSD